MPENYKILAIFLGVITERHKLKRKKITARSSNYCEIEHASNERFASNNWTEWSSEKLTLPASNEFETLHYIQRVLPQVNYTK